MYSIDDLARVVFGYIVRTADAKRNLKTYLAPYIRPEFLDKINFDAIFNGIGEISLGSKEIILEDIVDEYINARKGPELRSLLQAHARYKFGDRARDLVDSKEYLQGADKELLEKMVKEFVPLARKHIFEILRRQTLLWLKRHEREVPTEHEKMPEHAVLPEHEEEERMKERHKWEEGLIEDVNHVINEKVPKEKRAIYKIILDDMFINQSPLTIPQIAEKTKLSVGTIHGYKTDLIQILAEYLTERGLGGTFLEEGGMARKEIELPPYEETFKNSDNVKEFKEFVKDKKSSKMSEATQKVLNLFAEGKAVSEIETATGVAYHTIHKIKSEFFNPWYKEWYESKVEEIRHAGEIMNITADVVRIPYKKPEEKPGERSWPWKKEPKPYQKPEEKKEEETVEEEKEAMKSHKAIVTRAIASGDLTVIITFSAEYDNTDVLMGRKDPKKDPCHFRYEKYSVNLNESRMFGKVRRSVNYVFSQRLNDDGSFVGSSDSKIEIDGVVQHGHDNELQVQLDKYTEEKIKPEGMFPHKYVGTRYINDKTKKKYVGVRNFVESFRGLLVEDTIHKTRVKNWHELQLRKQTGPKVKETEVDKINEALFFLQQDLKTEQAKKSESHDIKKIEELKRKISELETALKGHKEDNQEIEDIINEEMKQRKPDEEIYVKAQLLEPIEVTAFIESLPPSENESVKNLIALFKEYKQDWPSKWLEPKDLDILARTLRRAAINMLETEHKNLKELKMTPEERNTKIRAIEAKHREDMDKALKDFEKVPDDLKARRDKFKEGNPEDYEALAKRKNLTWVGNTSVIEEVMAKVQRALKEPVKETLDDKGESVLMLEKSKYRSLEAFLEQDLNGLDTLGQALEHASLEPKAPEPVLLEKINSEIARSKEKMGFLTKTLAEMAKNENKELPAEEVEVIEDVRKEIPTTEHHLRKMESVLKDLKNIPALGAAEAALAKVEYFAGLYSLLSRILWFRETPILKCASEEGSNLDLHKLNILRSEAVQAIGMLAEKNIFDKSYIKTGIEKSKSRLKKFISAYNPETSVEASYDSLMNSPYRIVAAAEDLEHARTKMIFPGDEMAKAEHMIQELAGLKGKRTKGLAGVARAELDKIIRNVSEVFKEGFSNERIEALAKRDKLPFDKASVRLKKLEDMVAQQALSEFILKWQHIKERGGRFEKERSPLGNKPGHVYNEMGRFVESHLPQLFELSPIEGDLPKEPSRGIPTPKEIRERIEQEFMAQHPHFKEHEETLTEKEKVEEALSLKEDFYGADGGGGKRKKGRKKPAKNPPPSGTHENLKDSILQVFDKDPRYIVLTVLAMYSKRIRDLVKNLPDDEYIDVDSVIDAMVSSLKNLYFTILNLHVEPSASAMRLPPEGAPKFSGMPDIPINNLKDANRVFDKIKGIIDEINFYIAPDTVGVPPESFKDLSKSEAARRYLPRGLVEWGAFFQKQEKQAMDLGLSMGFRVANRFTLMEPVSEKDALII
jgi:hypothetical protein